MRCGWVLVLVAACGEDAKPIDPTANWSREIIDTKLTFDFTARTGTAKITFGPSTEPGASLEVRDGIDRRRVGRRVIATAGGRERGRDEQQGRGAHERAGI